MMIAVILILIMFFGGGKQLRVIRKTTNRLQINKNLRFIIFKALDYYQFLLSNMIIPIVTVDLLSALYMKKDYFTTSFKGINLCFDFGIRLALSLFVL